MSVKSKNSLLQALNDVEFINDTDEMKNTFSFFCWERVVIVSLLKNLDVLL